MPQIAELKLVLRNDLIEVERLGAAVDAFCAQYSLTPRIAFNLNLVLEEIVVNVINYAFPEAGQYLIYVDLFLGKEQVEGEVRDTGKAFDPLLVAPPDLDLDLDQRVVGGLGVHFLKTLTDEVRYTRRDGSNCLRFIKRITPESAEGTGCAAS